MRLFKFLKLGVAVYLGMCLFGFYYSMKLAAFMLGLFLVMVIGEEIYMRIKK